MAVRWEALAPGRVPSARDFLVGAPQRGDRRRAASQPTAFLRSGIAAAGKLPPARRSRYKLLRRARVDFSPALPIDAQTVLVRRIVTTRRHFSVAARMRTDRTKTLSAKRRLSPTGKVYQTGSAAFKNVTPNRVKTTASRRKVRAGNLRARDRCSHVEVDEAASRTSCRTIA